MASFPLSFDIDVEFGEPFVSSTDTHLKNRVIVRSMTLFGADHAPIYQCYEMVDPDPTDEEIFKITLKNPQPLVAVKVHTGEEFYHRREEDS